MKLVESLKKIVPAPSISDFSMYLGTNMAECHILFGFTKRIIEKKAIKKVKVDKNKITYTTKSDKTIEIFRKKTDGPNFYFNYGDGSVQRVNDFKEVTEYLENEIC